MISVYQDVNKKIKIQIIQCNRNARDTDQTTTIPYVFESIVLCIRKQRGNRTFHGKIYKNSQDFKENINALEFSRIHIRVGDNFPLDVCIFCSKLFEKQKIPKLHTHLEAIWIDFNA